MLLASCGLLFVVLIAVPCWALDQSERSFKAWQALHSKSYPTDEEYHYRLQIWQQNSMVVDRHNAAYEAGWTLYKMSMQSPFADLTDDEFQSLYLMDSQNCSATHTSSGKLRSEDVQIPTHVDWRTKGIITPVKNQGHCGSCWTFSTTGCLEAHTCLALGKDCTEWTGLAEQQLVDCAGDFNNNGCNGGLPSQAFEYIKYSGGLDLETAYPYLGEDSPCQAKTGGGAVGAQVAEIFNITTLDEDDLVHAVATVGPVSIAYQVSPDFRFYTHGIYDSFNATTNETMCQNLPSDVNHAVVAVGLGTTSNDEPFYIVRNSWGTSWGMEGYFWMKRGENLCGVSDCASFPLVPENGALTTALKRQLRG